MQLLKENLKERCAEFLSTKLGSFDKQAQADVAAGIKEFHTSDFYIRRKLDGTTGIQDAIKPTINFETGITNIDKARLGPGQYLAVGSIGIKYAYNASTTTPDTQEYQSCVFDPNNSIPDAVTAGFAVPARLIPVSFQNAEIEIKAGGKLIYRGRLSEFFSTSTVGYAADSNDENKKMLAVPKLIPAQAEITIQVKFGTNAVAVSNNHFLEVAFGGVYVGDRS